MSKEAMPQEAFDESVELFRTVESRLGDFAAEVAEQVERLERDDQYKESRALAAALGLIALNIGRATAMATAAINITPQQFGRHTES